MKVWNRFSRMLVYQNTNTFMNMESIVAAVNMFERLVVALTFDVNSATRLGGFVIDDISYEIYHSQQARCMNSL